MTAFQEVPQFMTSFLIARKTMMRAVVSASHVAIGNFKKPKFISIPRMKHGVFPSVASTSWRNARSNVPKCRTYVDSTATDS
jgi:hypothetical protein